MKEKRKKDKLLISCILVAIILVVGVTIGLSYAYWTYTATQGTVNTITTDCLKIELEDVTAAIDLQKAYPITDEEAEGLTPYTFKVTNVCNTNAIFDVNLEVMDVTNRLSSEYVAVSLNGTANSILSDNPKVDSTYKGEDYTAVEAYNLATRKLTGGESVSYSLRLWMDEDVTAADDAMNKNFTSKISVTASIDVNAKNYLCKRATALHTETCSQTSSSGHCNGDGYSNGATITYGNLGTSGTLTVGDAFDCDVNSDGIYNVASERFYYVSDATNGVTTDSNTAVLIYYNNVSGGTPNNITTYAYDSSNVNNNGPVTAIAQLPTTSQWSNVSLTNTTRAITNQSGGTTTPAGTLPTSFSYSGYAARLLTRQEVESGCYDGTTVSSSKCKFLMENTEYSSSSLTDGYWLETPNASYSFFAWYVTGQGGVGYTVGVNSTLNLGVRPAIEVLKSDISY